MFLTTTNPFLVHVQLRANCAGRGVSCDWLIPQPVAPQGRLHWGELHGRFFLRECLHVLFVLQPTSSCLWKTGGDGGQWAAGAEAAVGTFHEIGYFQTCFHETKHFFLQWKNCQTCVAIPNTMCHIRWGHYADCGAGSVKGTCSPVKVIFKTALWLQVFMGGNNLNMQNWQTNKQTNKKIGIPSESLNKPWYCCMFTSWIHRIIRKHNGANQSDNRWTGGATTRQPFKGDGLWWPQTIALRIRVIVLQFCFLAVNSCHC